MQHSYGYFEDDHIGQMGDISLWRRLLGFIIPQWRWAMVAILLSFVVTIASLALPRLIQMSMDQYIIGSDLGLEERLLGLTRLGVLFLAVIVIGFVSNFLQVIALEWTGQNIMHTIRQRLFTHMLTLNLSFFAAHPVGRLVTRLTNDIQNMYEMFTSVIITLFNDGIRLLGILAILYWMNWRLALLLCAMFPVMLVVTIWFGRLSRDAFRQLRAHLAAINAFLQEAVSGISVIQLFLRENDMHQRFTGLNERYYHSACYQIWIFGIFIPLIEVMSSVSLALIVWYGGKEILQEHMTIGVLTAFIAYMRLFFQPVRELSQKYSIVQSAMASAERIFHLMEVRDTLSIPAEPVVPENISGEIVFSGVNFAYETDRRVIKDLSLETRAGETLAIVGATGSGKTTLINLLERFYDPCSGSISLDGVDLRSFDPHWLREQVGLVMQDLFIVPGSIRENIELDRRLSDEDIQRILQLSQLSGMVGRLPEGLETKIGEGGMDLSAGQKQLLALARVFARNPRILVLDEATANVDTETEMLVEQAIEAALAGRTSIVIAHRLSTIRRADRILVMDRGRIVEQGTHDVLMEQRGLYYHLQTLQNGTPYTKSYPDDDNPDQVRPAPA
jgi:ATP-binding cassette subfamily B protein